MKQSIGQKLEEGRTKRGVSISEAVNSTKLRRKIIVSFEDDNFDIKLPEVYCRGFLRLYASYLKIDVEAVMLQYHTEKSSGVIASPQRTHNSLDRIEKLSEGTIDQNKVQLQNNQLDIHPIKTRSVLPFAKSTFLKAYVALGGAFLLVL